MQVGLLIWDLFFLTGAAEEVTGEMNLALAAVDTAKFPTAATKKAVNSSIFSRSPKLKPQNKNDCFDIHKVSLDTFKL